MQDCEGLLTADGQGAFNDEQISPRVELRFNVEHAKGKQSTESVCDIRRSVEESKPSCQLTSSVECSQIVDD